MYVTLFLRSGMRVCLRCLSPIPALLAATSAGTVPCTLNDSWYIKLLSGISKDSSNKQILRLCGSNEPWFSPPRNHAMGAMGQAWTNTELRAREMDNGFWLSSTHTCAGLFVQRKQAATRAPTTKIEDTAGSALVRKDEAIERTNK